jgi:hypothetical protein
MNAFAAINSGRCFFRRLVVLESLLALWAVDLHAGWIRISKAGHRGVPPKLVPLPLLAVEANCRPSMATRPGSPVSLSHRIVIASLPGFSRNGSTRKSWAPATQATAGRLPTAASLHHTDIDLEPDIPDIVAPP